MRIQSVRIKNFCTLKDVKIPFDSVTTFIGPNGAGKSTVLRALDWYFKGKLGLNLKLKYFGRTEYDFPAAVVAENVAIFDDHLETFLAANWPEWITACNDISAAAGISLAKNQLAYRTATLKAQGAVPEMLVQILAMAEGK